MHIYKSVHALYKKFSSSIPPFSTMPLFFGYMVSNTYKIRVGLLKIFNWGRATSTGLGAVKDRYLGKCHLEVPLPNFTSLHSWKNTKC